ncbi:MAG: hypothetical protein V3T95_02735 [Acidobacteriota bacterium]
MNGEGSVNFSDLRYDPEIQSTGRIPTFFHYCNQVFKFFSAGNRSDCRKRKDRLEISSAVYLERLSMNKKNGERSPAPRERLRKMLHTIASMTRKKSIITSTNTVVHSVRAGGRMRGQNHFPSRSENIYGKIVTFNFLPTSVTFFTTRVGRYFDQKKDPSSGGIHFIGYSATR